GCVVTGAGCALSILKRCRAIPLAATGGRLSQESRPRRLGRSPTELEEFAISIAGRQAATRCARCCALPPRNTVEPAAWCAVPNPNAEGSDTAPCEISR